MVKTDNNYHIDTDELFKLSKLKQFSTLRTYIGTYNIYVPVASDESDKRKYLFDSRCCLVRKALLASFSPRCGIKMEKQGELINLVCGKEDEILLKEFDDGKPKEKITEEKEKELKALSKKQAASKPTPDK